MVPLRPDALGQLRAAETGTGGLGSCYCRSVLLLPQFTVICWGKNQREENRKKQRKRIQRNREEEERNTMKKTGSNMRHEHKGA